MTLYSSAVSYEEEIFRFTTESYVKLYFAAAHKAHQYHDNFLAIRDCEF